ncbi:MAG TPA: dethiobiotin synthase [Streptosporangiaceae bacterium]|jgi:dethiobiotin synthetase
MSLLVISGTGTGVGKTVVTAAVCGLALDRADKVAVVKPAQTGLAAGELSDLEVVEQLSGASDRHELARFPDPLSPEAAARAAGLPPLDLKAAAGYIADLAATRDLVVVEGAGGLLVRYDPAGATVADLAALLGAPVLVVAEAGLGTLNQTALTLEALAARGLASAGVVIGSWPAGAGLTERSNVADLETIAGEPLAGILPGGLGQASRRDFLQAAYHGLSPAFGGRFDQAAFLRRIS